MPTRSIPTSKYFGAIAHAHSLSKCANNKRGRGSARHLSQGHYHAALTANVAAWEAFVENAIRHFLHISARPHEPHYHLIHTALVEIAEQELEKFNTPNAENSRRILMRYTGVDPWSHWIWPARGFNALQVRVLHDEILKVRHSFAHGLSLPAYSWLLDGNRLPRFTQNNLQTVNAHFNNLVVRTDRAIRLQLKTIFGTDAGW